MTEALVGGGLALIGATLVSFWNAVRGQRKVLKRAAIQAWLAAPVFATNYWTSLQQVEPVFRQAANSLVEALADVQMSVGLAHWWRPWRRKEIREEADHLMACVAVVQGRNVLTYDQLIAAIDGERLLRLVHRKAGPSADLVRDYGDLAVGPRLLAERASRTKS